jgi:hypothetical protein
VTPEGAAILDATHAVREAGEQLLGAIADIGVGHFARDRAQMFIVGRYSGGPIERGFHAHKQIVSLMAEAAYLVLPEPEGLLKALQACAEARDALWDLLAAWDAAERLGGAATAHSELGRHTAQIKTDVRSAASAAGRDPRLHRC